ncbi:ATP-binding cassette domain-containing protein [Fulvivirgaceae bacterium PWU4]|uniref:ATP-binding cassette domain-containing protein n=1 Tax=Chryseosolibacter histidini TaxID=2782349 RepID=A0AAP2DK01_9BACT|nr:ABC-F family ATP-binding cassette domain-containing protein [Chryseosolibacter histidini]MBT1696602.1 ATP-binding cassette domain-containing protein [Chryseosolibacter histidini]
MLTIQDITYGHPGQDVLFDNISFTINKHEKVALVGNNGVGKSTLLKIIAGTLQPSGGRVERTSTPYYIPQLFGQFNDLTIGQALQIDQKLKALNEILDGHATESNLALLDDDWTIESRCHEALTYWGLSDLDLIQKMGSLSGGQKTKVFLAGILIHQPEIVLLDEPSNHLDTGSRERLYNFVRSASATLVVVSHDRTLLNLLDTVYELRRQGITMYGGNYDFYAEQKQVERNALHEDVRSKEKELRKAKEVERETAERKQKLDARGKKKQEREGLPTISMNTFRNNAEKSTARLKGAHADKVQGIAQALNELRSTLPGTEKMKFGFDDSSLHSGKVLVEADAINFGYNGQMLWNAPMSFQVTSGERIVLKGSNGSGKTTLIKIMLGEMEPTAGTIRRVVDRAVYIDQDYSLINDQLSVYDQALTFNFTALQEHEVKIRLNRFLFTKDFWDKPCSTLSGGEKMRLMLCCLTIGNQAPDIIVLDEPTNNLDIQNTEILTGAINEYSGTLIVVSHDQHFLKEINVKRVIEL